MKDIFQFWPTTRAFAADIGVNKNTAQAWKNRGRIPGEFDLRIVAAASLRGFPVSLEVLARSRAAQAGVDDLLPTAGPHKRKRRKQCVSQDAAGSPRP